MRTNFILCLTFLALLFNSCNQEIKSNGCINSTGVVHFYHLVKDIYNKKNKGIDTSNTAELKIKNSYLTVNRILKKLMVIKPDSSGDNSYLFNGCEVSGNLSKAFNESGIYTDIRNIRLNQDLNESSSAKLDGLLDYYFLNENPYFGEVYLNNNTIDNICSDLILFQLEIIELL